MVNISIVIPLYNKAHYISVALSSILQQRHKGYEVIIVDDGSTDGSADAVAKFLSTISSDERKCFRVITQENQGVSVARNTGCSHAKFPYVALLDADDYWNDNHLSSLANLINMYGDRVDLFSCAVRQEEYGNVRFPNLGEHDNFVGIIDFFEVALKSSSFIHSSAVCATKSSLLKNEFPVGMKNMEDIITWARIANRKGFAFNSSRTCVQVLDGAEASRSVDFSSLERYAQLLKKVDYDPNKLKIFLRSMGIIALSGSRLIMPLSSYARESLKLFKMRSEFFKYALLILFVPKVLLNYVRARRKKT